MAAYSEQNEVLSQWWNSPKVGIPLWLISAGFLVYWLVRVPSPGKAIGAVAVVAGILSVREIKVLGKIAWVAVLSGMLAMEFRAIDRDRANNTREQAIFFESQRKGFESINSQAQRNFAITAAGLTKTIESLNTAISRINSTFQATNTTIKQTRPEAYVEFSTFTFGQDLSQTWELGRSFKVNFSFKNIGTMPATEVYKLGKFYCVDNNDEGIKSAYEAFQSDFKKDKRGPSLLLRDSERIDPEQEDGFSIEQMRQVQLQNKAIIFLFRAEYHDNDEKWGTQNCRVMQPLAHASGYEEEHQCTNYKGIKYNDPRYRIR